MSLPDTAWKVFKYAAAYVQDSVTYEPRALAQRFDVYRSNGNGAAKAALKAATPSVLGSALFMSVGYAGGRMFGLDPAGAVAASILVDKTIFYPAMALFNEASDPVWPYRSAELGGFYPVEEKGHTALPAMRQAGRAEHEAHRTSIEAVLS